MTVPIVYFINLPGSYERLIKMKDGLTRKCFAYKRVEAIKHEKPHIGCCLSHIKAIYTAFIDGNEEAIIMEDDVDLSKDLSIFKNFIENERFKIDKDWDVIQLHYTEPTLIKALNSREITYPNILMKGYFMSAVCYLINRKGMKTFLDFAIDNISNRHYNVKVDLSHPLCRSEELIYRYINSYVTLFPIINSLETNDSNISKDASYYNNNYNNMIEIDNFLSKNTRDYSLKFYYELPYHLHWFNGNQKEANELLSVIYNTDL